MTATSWSRSSSSSSSHLSSSVRARWAAAARASLHGFGVGEPVADRTISSSSTPPASTPTFATGEGAFRAWAEDFCQIMITSRFYILLLGCGVGLFKSLQLGMLADVVLPYAIILSVYVWGFLSGDLKVGAHSVNHALSFGHTQRCEVLGEQCARECVPEKHLTVWDLLRLSQAAGCLRLAGGLRAAESQHHGISCAHARRQQKRAGRLEFLYIHGRMGPPCLLHADSLPPTLAPVRARVPLGACKGLNHVLGHNHQPKASPLTPIIALLIPLNPPVKHLLRTLAPHGILGPHGPWGCAPGGELTWVERKPWLLRFLRRKEAAPAPAPAPAMLLESALHRVRLASSRK